MNIELNRPPASIRLECGPVTALDLALYAASSSDHNPLHLDDEIARAVGFERPVVHGTSRSTSARRRYARWIRVS
jgi:acyl dehydratase